MENDADFGRQKSINEIIARARDEKNRAVNTIDFLLNYKLPSIILNSQDIQNNLNNIAKSLNIKLELTNNIEELKKSFITSLNLLKQQLQNIEMTEEELLTSTIIGESYALLEEISHKMDSIPGKILENGKNEIIKGVSEKEELDNKQCEINSKKIDLEKQEMYLKGMLEVTILPKKKKELEERILQIRMQIGNLDKELININSFGNNESNNNKLNSEEKEDIEFE